MQLTWRNYLRASKQFIKPLNFPFLEPNSSSLYTNNFETTTTTTIATTRSPPIPITHQPTNNTNTTTKMQLTHLLSAALLPLAALSSPVAVPGEIVRGTSGNVPGKATWFCTFSYEIVFDHYVLEGHKFGASEAEIKEVIPGRITSWEFYHVGEGWSDFVAKVCWSLPVLLF